MGSNMTSWEIDTSAKKEKTRPRIQPMMIPQIPIILAIVFETKLMIPDAKPAATIIRMAMDNRCTAKHAFTLD